MANGRLDKDRLLVEAKHAYVGLVRGVEKGLARAGIGVNGAPDVDRRVSHWAYSLTRVHDSLELAELGVPWWTYNAIDAVDRWLRPRQGQARAFEYGSGASTVWLAGRVRELHSVEHHRGFADTMKPTMDKLATATVEVVEPEPDPHPAVRSAKEGHAGLDFSNYVDTINRVGGLFDLIVIDGRAREACLAASLPHLSPDGLIIFDNSWRRRYRSSIESSGLVERRLRGLVPTLPYPDQTSLLTRPRPA